MDDYQALGLGEATSVVTAVTVDTNDQSVSLFCLYDPQQESRPYTLRFRQCEHIVWDTFGDVPDLQHLEAELVGLSLQTSEASKLVIITTDMFELSFRSESFSVETYAPGSSQTAPHYPLHPTAARERL